MTLKIHNGAVDRNMITTGTPQQVFANVTEVLRGMGIEVAQDSAFSYRCVRAKRKKSSAGPASGMAAFQMSGLAGSHGVSVFLLVGASN